jgi:murein DD-endopeptidase MepM/ murein hydrolase activator NlpD
MNKYVLSFLLIFALTLSACAPAIAAQQFSIRPTSLPFKATPDVTAFPTRPNYRPGELVNYIAQSGDTLPALAARFNTSVDEILQANSFIPRDATTMPPGMPMKIPIYYLPLWASPYQVLPDHAFVNGPTLIGFNTTAFVASHTGWLKNYRAYAGSAWRSGAGIVDYVASNFSVSPRLLLALLEYQSGALSQPDMPKDSNLLGFHKEYYGSLYLQLVQAADTLNNGYYGWRIGNLLQFDLLDGRLFRPDPGDNAASVGVKYYFSIIFSGDKFDAAIGPSGLARTYAALFGDPWQDSTVLIPGSLHQPELPFPFQDGQVWSYTGGPHTGWGTGEPYTAIDFAPPTDKSGCFAVEPKNYVIAVADGTVVRSELGTVVLDLDGDGNERTGWNIYYLHIATSGRAPLGQQVKRGDFIGYPSCEGGHVTGTHVHIARKYNGEWILADGPLAFVLDGWTVHNGLVPYKGTLTKGSLIVTACECGDLYTEIRAGVNP